MYKVTPGGTITTIAGTGRLGVSGAGFSGDGGPATRATLYSPQAVALDRKGNLYIADPVAPPAKAACAR